MGLVETVVVGGGLGIASMARSIIRLRRLQVESKELFLLDVDCPVASAASVPRDFFDQDR